MSFFPLLRIKMREKSTDSAKHVVNQSEIRRNPCGPGSFVLCLFCCTFHSTGNFSQLTMRRILSSIKSQILHNSYEYKE